MNFFYLFVAADAVLSWLLTGHWFVSSWWVLWLGWYLVECEPFHVRWLTWVSQSVLSLLHRPSFFTRSSATRMGSRIRPESIDSPDWTQQETWTLMQLSAYYLWFAFVIGSTLYGMTRLRGCIHSTLSRLYPPHESLWKSIADRWKCASPFAAENESSRVYFHSCSALHTALYLFGMYIWMETLENLYPCHDVYHQTIWVVVWLEHWFCQRVEWICLAWPLEASPRSFTSRFLRQAVIQFWQPFLLVSLPSLRDRSDFGNGYVQNQRVAQVTHARPDTQYQTILPHSRRPVWWTQLPWVAYATDIPEMQSYYDHTWTLLHEARTAASRG